MLTGRRGWLVRKRFSWGEDHRTQNKTLSHREGAGPEGSPATELHNLCLHVQGGVAGGWVGEGQVSRKQELRETGEG